MSHVSRFLLLLTVLLLGLWAFLFALANSASVALDLVFIELPPAAVSVWVIAAFVAGGLCGLAAGSVVIWRARRALSRIARPAPAPARPAQSPPGQPVTD